MIDPLQLGRQVVKTLIEQTDNTKKVVVYSGRFQPFHPGHYKVYQHLTQKFGKDNVYIGTSDKVDKPKSPLNFKEKVKVMTKMFGIPTNKIVQIKNPYAPKEILQKFSKDTVYITAIGSKDVGRLGGKYFTKYETGIDYLGYEERGYIYNPPSPPLSGTEVRDLLGDPSYSDDVKQVNFKKIYGNFDKEIFDILTDKLTESVVLEWVIERNGVLLESITSGIRPDDGPAFMSKNMKAYRSLSQHRLDGLLQTGWTIVKYLVDDEKLQPLNSPKYPNGPVPAVSYYPAGDIGKRTTTNQIDIYGTGAFRAWKKHILRGVAWLGWEYVTSKAEEFLIRKRSELDAKNTKKQLKENTTKKNFNRIDFYKEYFENLIPEGFEISKQNDSIVISQKKIKEVKTLNTTLSIPRQQMPQISSKHRDEYLQFLENNNIGYKKIKIKLSELKNTQKDLDLDKIQKLSTSERKQLEKPIIISSDNYILDGHHRANALYNIDEKLYIDTIKVNLPIKKLLYVSKQFDKVGYKTVSESLLTEGGAYGRLNHPFDDMSLTFDDLKKMIELGLSGRLDIETGVREKTDGQNLSFSWRDDKGGLIAARNKSHIKDNGANALTSDGVKQMFSGRGEVENAFSYAVDDIQKAVSSLSKEQREDIFGNGSKFMSMEVIYIGTENVIPYGENMLVFHGTIEYDENGNAIKEDKESARLLSNMITKVNQNIQNTFKIKAQPIVSIPKSRDFSKSKSKYFSELNRLQSRFRLKNTDMVSMYHQKWWEDFIMSNANKYKYSIPNHVFMRLVQRWAFSDKSFSVRDMKKEITDQKFLDWVLSFDKKDHATQIKENIRPFEELFLRLGAEILQNVNDLLTVNPEESVKKLRKNIESAISELQKSKDPSVIEKFKRELQRIEATGGLDRLVPSEGIVFEFKGKNYKLTGLFAPVNQLLGILKYG